MPDMNDDRINTMMTAVQNVLTVQNRLLDYLLAKQAEEMQGLDSRIARLHAEVGKRRGHAKKGKDDANKNNNNNNNKSKNKPIISEPTTATTGAAMADQSAESANDTCTGDHDQHIHQARRPEPTTAVAAANLEASATNTSPTGAEHDHHNHHRRCRRGPITGKIVKFFFRGLI